MVYKSKAFQSCFCYIIIRYIEEADYMKELIKKAIVCSLVAGFLQYGLSTSLVKAASHDDQQLQQQQDDQQQQDKKRFEEQKRKDSKQQGQQRPDQQRQDQQRQDRQRPEQQRQDQQRQDQQRQDRQRPDQQRQDQQRQDQQRQDRQRPDQQRQVQQRQDQQRQDQQFQQQQQYRDQQRQQQRDQRRHDWSQDAYRNDNWHGTSRQYNESSPFKWHESRSSMNERFSSDYRMDRIDDDAWNNRFPGLHSYRWHDSDRYNQGDFWYRGVRVRDAVLFYDDSDELVGTGFMFNNEFVFIRDDQEVYQRNDSLLLRTISLLLKL